MHFQRHEKTEVAYSKGMPSSHCGPTREWPKGYCRYFVVPDACEKVKGTISSTMWCRCWKAPQK